MDETNSLGPSSTRVEEASSKQHRFAPKRSGLETFISAQAAERHYHAALACDEAYAPALQNLGGVYLGRGDAARAVELFGRAAEAQPEQDSHRANLAVAQSVLDGTASHESLGVTFPPGALH